MRTRILWALLGLTILFWFTWYFYSEVIVDYYWFIKTQLKSATGLFIRGVSETWILTVRNVSEIWLPTARVWLMASAPTAWIGAKAFFARQVSRLTFIDLPKKFIVIPFLMTVIGIPGRRKLREISAAVKLWVKEKKAKFIALPKWIQTIVIVGTIVAIVGGSFVVWWFGFFLFFVTLPKWMAAPFIKLALMIWAIVQRTLFQGVIFSLTKRVHLFVITHLFPDEFERQLRRMLYRSARSVIRSRKLTVTQLEEKGLTASLYWQIEKERWSRIPTFIKEYFSKKEET